AGLASIVPFFLVSNLLLLNQFPDVEADASAARRHLPIVIGRKGSSDVYALLLVAAYVALVISVVAEVLPYMALFGLLTLPLGLMAVRGARKYCDEIENLIPVMGRNVLLTLLLPLLMAIGIIIS
ncbi:MAG: prenyltransferase, partial [Dehalococcoidia bacterium]